MSNASTSAAGVADRGTDVNIHNNCNNFSNIMSAGTNAVLHASAAVQQTALQVNDVDRIARLERVAHALEQAQATQREVQQAAVDMRGNAGTQPADRIRLLEDWVMDLKSRLDGQGSEPIPSRARDDAPEYIQQSQGDIEHITAKEAEFLKWVIEQYEAQGDNTESEWLLGVLKARRDYVWAVNKYGVGRARTIFEDKSETAYIARRMAQAIQLEGMDKSRSSTVAEAGGYSNGQGQMATPQQGSALTCFNCGGAHMARECPIPFDPIYRQANGRRGGRFPSRGRGYGMASSSYGQFGGRGGQLATAPGMPTPYMPAWGYGAQTGMGYQQQYYPPAQTQILGQPAGQISGSGAASPQQQ